MASLCLIEQQETPMNEDTVCNPSNPWNALGVLGASLTRVQGLYCALFEQGGKNAFELAEVGKSLRHLACEYRRAVQTLSGGTPEDEDTETETTDVFPEVSEEEEDDDDEF
jgi:hypothetical protein